MANPRVAKLAEQIRMVVAEMLERRLKDPRLGFVTITDVRLTGDTRDATVFYTVLGEESDLTGTQAALESAKGLIRSTVGQHLGLKFAPTVEFVLDATPETAKSIEDALARAQALDAAVAQQAANATYAGDADPYRKPEQDTDDDES
ncbi:MAG TPA: 30S ribosome-binding factor RbfA [Propionibacteriaceae bacterium]|nr:30S ribosome-binding factor RbfA [Propionibacteriaceae bacterium]